MKTEILTALSFVVQRTFVSIQSELKETNLSTKRRNILGLTGLAYADLLTFPGINDIQSAVLKKMLYKLFDIVYDEANLFHFNSFYSSYGTVKDGNEGKMQGVFTKANYCMLALRLKQRVVSFNFTSFGDSTDRYFLDRLERLLWGLKALFKDSSLAHLHELGLYVLLNLHQTIIELYESNNYAAQDLLYKSLIEVHKLLKELTSRLNIQNRFSQNLQLYYFYLDQNLRYSRLTDTPFDKATDKELDIRSFTMTKKLWTLYSLSFINKDDFVMVFDENFDQLIQNIEVLSANDQVMLMWVLVRYLKCTVYKGNLSINLTYSSPKIVDTLSVLTKHFNFYESIAQNADSITDDELTKLMSFKDAELRNKVAATIRNVDPVVLRREAEKPHGQFEISDMEIPIYNGVRRTYFLCMPFKSGAEIKTKTVPVTYANQVWRPFILLDDCIVVFITAKKCFQSLIGEFKMMESRFGWSISIIQHKELAALLKLNNQL